MHVTQEQQWVITKTEAATLQVKNLYLEPVEGERPGFIAGQYLTVKLPGQTPAEGKAYSISSAPHESQVRLSIKQIGDFSKALLSLGVGDTLISSAPYGFFYPEPDDTGPLVFVVGGIGITPCLSIIKDLIHTNSERPIHLHYSNQTEAEIAFYEELIELEAQHKALSVTFYVTREKPNNTLIRFCRMQASDIVNSPEFDTEAEIFICGSMDFTKSLWKNLVATGVARHQLYTEGFF